MITCRELTKDYGTGQERVQALRAINLTVDAGEHVAVMGKSGCGKTTLINILATIDQPTDGTYYFHDMKISQAPEKEQINLRRNHISVIFQQYNLLRDLTARENILLPFQFSKQKVDRQLFDRLVDRLQLRDRLHHMPDQLSGGQQQRVAICRALLTKPELVLADEPTGNLDSATGAEVIQLIMDCCAEFGQTLMLVTHDPDIAARLQRVITMHDGKIVSDSKSATGGH